MTSATSVAKRPSTRSCGECGGSMEGRDKAAAFCDKRCRDNHKNRRCRRGVLLYDLFMALRFERKLASKLKVWSAMCRLAGTWREEDNHERAGRRSWGDWRGWLEANPWVFFMRPIQDMTGRRNGTR